MKSLSTRHVVTLAAMMMTGADAAAQTVSSSTDFQQYVNSPPVLACSGAASVDYSGGVQMRIAADIMDAHGQLKARHCNPGDCWSYTPNNSTNVEVTHAVNIDTEPVGEWRCIIYGTVQIDYSLFIDFDGSATQTVEPRNPQDLKSVPNDAFTFTAPGDYLRTRIWQVWDNYDLPWTYTGFPVTESFSIGSNGCNIQLITKWTATNNEGRFEDKYGNFDGNSRINACALPQYQQCETQSTQTITVAGVPFSHGVTWRCSDVEISRQ